MTVCRPCLLTPVNTTLAATPLRRATFVTFVTFVTFAPGANVFLDDPRLVILRSAPPPLQPAQNLDPHRLMTLKLDLRPHASRNTPRRTRRRSSDAHVFSGMNPANIMLTVLVVAEATLRTVL
jgi:hypothetical protein